MNGKNIFHYKTVHDTLRNDKLKTRESMQKFYSFESSNKLNSSRVSNEKLRELRNTPELFKKLLDTAIIIEKEQKETIAYEFNFSIRYHTLFGERIAITGETDFLGNWDPLKGLELEWTEGGNWKANILIGEGILKDFEYKYVCIKKSEIQWESGRNRVFQIGEGTRRNSYIVFDKQDFWQET